MNVLIAGIGRNIEHSISFLKFTFENIAASIDKCAVVIYENNSTDHSAELLTTWNNQDARVYTVSEVFSVEEQLRQGRARTWDKKPCRIEIISAARNKLLEIILRPEYDNFDLVLMMDLDIPQPLPLEETLNAIYRFPKNAAAVFSYGVNSVGRMYDLYAYRDRVFPFGPEIVESFFSTSHQKRLFRHFDKIRKKEFHPVFSAFNGAGLYRRELLKGCLYSAHPTQDLDRLYRKQAECLGGEPADWFSPQNNDDVLSGAYLFGAGGFFYRNNSGYDFPIVNEHTGLHASLLQKGELLLRPSWIHRSNHIGYTFRLESIVRKIQQIMKNVLFGTL